MRTFSEKVKNKFFFVEKYISVKFSLQTTTFCKEVQIESQQRFKTVASLTRFASNKRDEISEIHSSFIVKAPQTSYIKYHLNEHFFYSSFSFLVELWSRRKISLYRIKDFSNNQDEMLESWTKWCLIHEMLECIYAH